MASVGYPLTSKAIRSSVSRFVLLITLNTILTKKKKLAGPDWLKSFLAHHPHIAKRKSLILNPGRPGKLNRIFINNYFNKLETVMMELNVLDKPQRLYNVDEKGSRLRLQKQPYVYAQRGTKYAHTVRPEYRESVTIGSCRNAIGYTIPPMMLKGKRKKSKWQDILPPGCDTVMTPKGSMTCEVFIYWLDHLANTKVKGIQFHSIQISFQS